MLLKQVRSRLGKYVAARDSWDPKEKEKRGEKEGCELRRISSSSSLEKGDLSDERRTLADRERELLGACYSV